MDLRFYEVMLNAHQLQTGQMGWGGSSKVKWTLKYTENLGEHRNVSIITLGVTVKT